MTFTQQCFRDNQQSDTWLVRARSTEGVTEASCNQLFNEPCEMSVWSRLQSDQALLPIFPSSAEGMAVSCPQNQACSSYWVRTLLCKLSRGPEFAVPSRQMKSFNKTAKGWHFNNIALTKFYQLLKCFNLNDFFFTSLPTYC